MDLHAEIPLIALLVLVHFGVTLIAAALGGAGRGNKRCVYHRAGLEHQAFGSQCGVDGGQYLNTEAVLFQEVAKPKNGGFVKRAHHARVQPRKFAVRRDIMQSLLHRRVRQSKPLLQEVDAQHGLNGKQRASAFGRCATEYKRLHQTNQFGPRHHQCQTELWLLTRTESRHLRRVSTVFSHLAQGLKLK